MNALNLALIMFFLIVIGYLCRKIKIVGEGFGQSLSVFLFNIIFPAIIISSMSMEFDRNDMRNSIHLILISLGTMALMFLIASVAGLTDHSKDNFSGIMKFAMMFPNFTFMAFPVMETLFPDKGLFYISMYTIPTRIFIYILGPLLMREKRQGQTLRLMLRESLRALLTPPVLAIPVGIALYLTGLKLPVPIHETLLYLARVATPMGMILSGVILAEASFGNMIREKRLYLLTILRLVAAPVLIYIFLLPFRLDPIVYKISVLYCALPIASSTTVFAVQYDNHPDLAAGGVFMTTVFSIITIPISAYLLEIMV
jgi:malate permease and related proteins